MALQISKATLFGVEATYWRVVATTIDHSLPGAAVRLVGYLNQTTRWDGRAALGECIIRFNDIDGELAFQQDMTREDVYLAIKTLDAWKSAKDV